MSSPKLEDGCCSCEVEKSKERGRCAYKLDLDGLAKTDTQPLPLSRLACDVLKERKKEQASESPFVFPRPRSPGKPIHSVKRACRTAVPTENSIQPFSAQRNIVTLS